MTEDHLTLSEGILPEDASNKSWKTIEAEWQTVMPNFKTLVATNYEEKLWLDELAKVCERRFSQDYRGFGVASFYKTKHKSRREHALEIRRRIEGELFLDWKNGARSMAEISRVIAALRETAEERIHQLDERMQTLRNDEERVRAQATANAHEWGQTGAIKNLVLRSRSRLFDAQAVTLQELYIYLTRLEGLQFARKLAEEVIAELDDLKGQVDQAASQRFNIFFGSNSFELDNKAHRDVGRLLQLVESSRDEKLEVVLLGFADNQGDPEENLRLSRQRAEAVKSELIAVEIVKPDGTGNRTVIVEGFGEAKPVASNSTEEGRSKNRRVEVWLRR